MYIKSNDLFKQTHPEKIYDSIPRPIIIADHLLTPDNMGSMIRLLAIAPEITKEDHP